MNTFNLGSLAAKLAVVGVVAATLSWLPAGAMASDRYDGGRDAYRRDTYRVVHVTGDQALPIRRHPFGLSRVTGALPFDARQVDKLEERFGRWARVNANGVTGWVKLVNLAPDAPRSGTQFEVVGLRPGEALNVHRRAALDARVVAVISAAGKIVDKTGACVVDFCPVGFRRAGGGPVEGFVLKRHLVVVSSDEARRSSEAADTGDAARLRRDVEPYRHGDRYRQGRASGY